MCCAEQPVGETCNADKSGCPPRIPTLLCSDHPTAVREGKFHTVELLFYQKLLKKYKGQMFRANLSIKQNLIIFQTLNKDFSKFVDPTIGIYDTL